MDGITMMNAHLAILHAPISENQNYRRRYLHNVAEPVKVRNLTPAPG
jgi:hypothetical protein